MIASVEMPLASLLQRDARFQEIYSDAIARVFVARGHTAIAHGDDVPATRTMEAGRRR